MFCVLLFDSRCPDYTEILNKITNEKSEYKMIHQAQNKDCQFDTEDDANYHAAMWILRNGFTQEIDKFIILDVDLAVKRLEELKARKKAA